MATALAVVAMSGAPVSAQSNAERPSDANAKAGDAAIASGDATSTEHLFGDWGGIRTSLSDRGIDLKASYLSETAGIVSGGLRHGTAYADQEKLQADIDLQTLAGWTGWSLHGTILSRHGISASSEYLGDDLGAVQEIYGATDDAKIHLGQFYLQHMSGGPFAIDVKFGRLPVGADFNTSPLFCGFLSLGMCPQPRGQSIDGSFSVDPSSTWGGRIKAGSQDFYLMGGAYQVRPHYGGRYGFDWGFSHTIGVILPFEAAWTPRLGAQALQGHYKVGFTYDSTNRPDLTPGHRIHDHSLSLYAAFDQMLVRTGKSGTDGVILIGGWTHANRHTAIFRDYAYAGVVAHGIVPSRPADTIEALVSHGWISHALTESQRVALASGEALPTGFPPAPGSFGGPATAPGIQTSTTVYEINYGVHAAKGITLTPDLQYVEHPGATHAVPSALVIAGRAEVDF